MKTSQQSTRDDAFDHPLQPLTVRWPIWSETTSAHSGKKTGCQPGNVPRHPWTLLNHFERYKTHVMQIFTGATSSQTLSHIVNSCLNTDLTVAVYKGFTGQMKVQSTGCGWSILRYKICL